MADHTRHGGNMRIRTITVAAAAAAVVALTGCSSGSSNDAAPSGPGVAVQAKTVGKLDAAAIEKQLAAAVPTVTMTVEYTAANDPNKRLGRPHQYTSKLQFADSRVSKAQAKETSDDPTDIAYGGTIEVFANDDDAKAWIKYVDGIGKAMGGLLTPDYLLRQGRYVIRASHLLTPDQAGEYDAVLANLR